MTLKRRQFREMFHVFSPAVSPASSSPFAASPRTSSDNKQPTTSPNTINVPEKEHFKDYQGNQFSTDNFAKNIQSFKNDAVKHLQMDTTVHNEKEFVNEHYGALLRIRGSLKKDFEGSRDVQSKESIKTYIKQTIRILDDGINTVGIPEQRFLLEIARDALSGAMADILSTECTEIITQNPSLNINLNGSIKTVNGAIFEKLSQIRFCKDGADYSFDNYSLSTPRNAEIASFDKNDQDLIAQLIEEQIKIANDQMSESEQEKLYKKIKTIIEANYNIELKSMDDVLDKKNIDEKVKRR